MKLSFLFCAHGRCSEEVCEFGVNQRGSMKGGGPWMRAVMGVGSTIWVVGQRGDRNGSKSDPGVLVMGPA